MDLHRVYKNLVAAIFNGIEQCAATMPNDAKTPHSMIKLGKRTDAFIEVSGFSQISSFRLENYHQMQRK